MRTHLFKNRKTGSTIPELPVNLWVFIFFLMLPFIDFVTLGYRAVFAYFGVRDACYQAALQQTFTSGMSTANSVLGQDSGAWHGVSYSPNNTQICVVQVDQNGTETVGAANTPWSQIIVQSDVYLIRLNATANIDPIINMTGSPLPKIQGLSAPLTFQLQYQVTAENPAGLVK